jgi:hypothetical protein
LDRLAASDGDRSAHRDVTAHHDACATVSDPAYSDADPGAKFDAAAADCNSNRGARSDRDAAAANRSAADGDRGGQSNGRTAGDRNARARAHCCGRAYVDAGR